MSSMAMYPRRSLDTVASISTCEKLNEVNTSGTDLFHSRTRPLKGVSVRAILRAV